MGSSKGHPCNECGKDFSSVHQLAQHQRIHTGEKPYKCGYCDRTFKQLSHVQQHTRLHTGERPYKCPKPDCGRDFIQLSNLNQHLKVHSNGRLEDLSNLVCVVCTRVFKTESNLYSHKCLPRNTRSPSSLTPPRETRGRPTKHSYGRNDHESHTKRKKKNSQFEGKPFDHESQSLSSSTSSSTSTPVIISQSPPTTNANQISFISCSICGSLFPSQMSFLTHIQQMRGDGRHEF